jgi:TPR repeat protein
MRDYTRVVVGFVLFALTVAAGCKSEEERKKQEAQKEAILGALKGQVKDRAGAASKTDLPKACEQGNHRACVRLGIQYLKGRDGVAQDFAQAAKYLGKACEGKIWQACKGLGDLYRDGKGVPKDEPKSFALFKSGCDNDDTLSCRALGLAYLMGRGTAKDGAKALEIQQKACTKKDAISCMGVGAIYLNGLGGVAKDAEKAKPFLKQACDGGMKTACQKLATL